MQTSKQIKLNIIKQLMQSCEEPIVASDLFPEQKKEEPFWFKVLELNHVNGPYDYCWKLCNNELYTFVLRIAHMSQFTGLQSLEVLLRAGYQITKVETSHGIFSIGDIGVHMNNVVTKKAKITKFEILGGHLFVKSNEWNTNMCYIQKSTGPLYVKKTVPKFFSNEFFGRNAEKNNITLFTPEQTRAIELIVAKETRVLKSAVIKLLECSIGDYSSTVLRNLLNQLKS